MAIDVYGCIQPEDLSLGTSTTIFSSSDASGNEAIIKYGFAEAVKKTNTNLATQLENEAKELLDRIWGQMAPRQQNNQRLDRPFINSPNFFGPNRNFSIPELKYFFAEYQRKIFIASFK